MHFEITGKKFVLEGRMAYLLTVILYSLPMIQGLAEVCYSRIAY